MPPFEAGLTAWELAPSPPTPNPARPKINGRRQEVEAFVKNRAALSLACTAKARYRFIQCRNASRAEPQSATMPNNTIPSAAAAARSSRSKVARGMPRRFANSK